MPQRVVAPYITTWSAEHNLPAKVVVRNGSGIAYEDETAVDRDSNGILWYRSSFDDPAIPWMRATNLLRELRGCAIVSPADFG